MAAEPSRHFLSPGAVQRGENKHLPHCHGNRVLAGLSGQDILAEESKPRADQTKGSRPRLHTPEPQLFFLPTLGC